MTQEPPSCCWSFKVHQIPLPAWRVGLGAVDKYAVLTLSYPRKENTFVLAQQTLVAHLGPQAL